MRNPKYWIILVVLVALIGLAAVIFPQFGQAIGALAVIALFGGLVILYFVNGG